MYNYIYIYEHKSPTEQVAHGGTTAYHDQCTASNVGAPVANVLRARCRHSWHNYRSPLLGSQGSQGFHEIRPMVWAYGTYWNFNGTCLVDLKWFNHQTWSSMDWFMDVYGNMYRKTSWLLSLSIQRDVCVCHVPWGHLQLSVWTDLTLNMTNML